MRPGVATPSDAVEVVRDLVEQVARSRPAALSLETKLVELELDSLQLLEMLVLVEEHYGAPLPEDYPDTTTVGDVVRDALTGEPQGAAR